MSTPNGNRGGQYASPYGTPMRNYPSQSGDFLSLEVGGPGAPPTVGIQQPQQSFNDYGRHSRYSGDGGAPYFYQNRQQLQPQRGEFHYRGVGGFQQHTNNNYIHNNLNNINNNNSNNNYRNNRNQNSNNYQQQNRRNAGGRGGWRGTRGGFANRNRGRQNGYDADGHTDDIEQYIHESFFEDPWAELMERHLKMRENERLQYEEHRIKRDENKKTQKSAAAGSDLGAGATTSAAAGSNSDAAADTDSGADATSSAAAGTDSDAGATNSAAAGTDSNALPTTEDVHMDNDVKSAKGDIDHDDV